MRRVIGMDIHRTFAEVVYWEIGRLRPVDMTREVWLRDPDIERLRRLVARRNQIARLRTRFKRSRTRSLRP